MVIYGQNNERGMGWKRKVCVSERERDGMGGVMHRAAYFGILTITLNKSEKQIVYLSQ